MTRVILPMRMILVVIMMIGVTPDVTSFFTELQKIIAISMCAEKFWYL